MFFLFCSLIDVMLQAHNEEEWQLREYIRQHRTIGHVTVEGVVSGPGLGNVYSYLQHTQQVTAHCSKLWVAHNPLPQAPALDVGNKPLQVVVAEEGKKGNAPCLRALDIVLRAWAAECRQAAMR